MPDKWFHCYTEKCTFGFSINDQNVINKVDHPPAKENILWKKASDPKVRQWIKDNTLSVFEVKPTNEGSLRAEL